MINKKVLKNVLIIIIGMMILGAMMVSAEVIIDNIDDVCCKTKDNKNNWVFLSRNNSDHPNIDIESLEYELSDSILTLRMNLAGEINISVESGYEIYYGNYTEYKWYRARYNTNSNQGSFSSFGFENNIKGELGSPVLEDNKSYSISFEINESDLDYVLWGYANEYNEDNTIIWIDYAPSWYEDRYYKENNIIQTNNDTSDVNETNDLDDTINGNQSEDNNDDNDSSSDEMSGNDGNSFEDTSDENGTPGFGIIILISVIILMLLCKRSIK